MSVETARVAGVSAAVSAVIAGAAVIACAWLVNRSLDRNAQASEALAVAQFCAQRQLNSIQEADCDLFGRALRSQAWLALAPPAATE